MVYLVIRIRGMVNIPSWAEKTLENGLDESQWHKMKECFIVPHKPLLSLLCRQPSPADELKETRTTSS